MSVAGSFVMGVICVIGAILLIPITLIFLWNILRLAIALIVDLGTIVPVIAIIIGIIALMVWANGGLAAL